MTQQRARNRVADQGRARRIPQSPNPELETPTVHGVNGNTIPMAEGAVAVPHSAGRPRLYARFAKPIMDRVIASLLLLLLAPVFLLTCAVVYLTLGRPLFYVQTRIGHLGEPFEVFKFRTMRPDRRMRAKPVTVERRQFHKRTDDPRHVPAGRCLRALHLDELPQLLNVLRGDMSLVGPRPELPHVVDQYEPWQHRRHVARPGITGLWQVSRQAQPMYEHVDLDITYIEQMSFWGDVRLLLLTIPAVLSRRGQ